jgi:Ca2+-binding EF-hand superfamily protein
MCSPPARLSPRRTGLAMRLAEEAAASEAHELRRMHNQSWFAYSHSKGIAGYHGAPSRDRPEPYASYSMFELERSAVIALGNPKPPSSTSNLRSSQTKSTRTSPPRTASSPRDEEELISWDIGRLARARAMGFTTKLAPAPPSPRLLTLAKPLRSRGMLINVRMSPPSTARPGQTRFNTLKGTYEYTREDGTVEDHRNMHCTMTSRHLDFGPPPKVKVSPRVLPKVLRVLLKAEARREKERSPAFAQAKASLESALARSLNTLVKCFSQWDADGSGTIDKLEFRKAVTEQLGWSCKMFATGSAHSWGPENVCDAVFADHDVDGSGTVEYKEYVRYALRGALKRSHTRIIDIFKKWDADGSRMIEKAEFRRAVEEIGFDAPSEELNAIFDMIDTDGSGVVSYEELHALLRRGSDITLEKSLQDGVKGEIETEARLKIATRKDVNERRGPMRAATVDELRKAISERYTRVMDLFKMFDKNGDGRVAKSEFRAALPLLGFDSSYAPVIDNLFDSLDVDGSGSIDHIELNARLRQGADVALDEALQDGAMGEIVLEAKLKIAARTGLDDRGTSAPLEVVTVDALRQALVSGLTRVVEVFRMLDRNLDGIVTKKEFRAALPLLGFDGRNTTVVDQLFDELDVDQSGSVDYDELAARLEMRGASAQVREELRATFNTDEQKALESERYGHNPLAAKQTFWAPSGLGA